MPNRVVVEEEEEEVEMELIQIQGLQQRLAHFFIQSDPKWPSFVIDFFKIILLSIVFYNFGVQRYQVTYFYTYNEYALLRIFSPSEAVLGDLNLVQEELGKFSVTDVRQITGFIDFILHTLDDLDHYSLYYSHESGTTVCLQKDFMSCRVLNSLDDFKAEEWLKAQVPFRSWKEANVEFISLSFSIKAGTRNTEESLFRVEVLFDNSYHDGMMPLHLKIGFEPPTLRTTCSNEYIRHLNCLLLLITSFISLFPALRRTFTGICLGIETRNVFKRLLHRELELKEKCEFLDFSNILRIVGCALKISGCAFIIYLRYFDVIDPQAWDSAAVFMSIVYFYSILHLGSYMKSDKPNVIYLTIKYSAPKFMRFILPSFCVYCAFVLNAWIVIGPYHPKFKEIQVSSESLFSLINGDDMFPTFNSLSGLASPLVIVFFKIFLYTFIILFIYLLLSITISIVSSTYEDISKKCEENPDWRKEKKMGQRLHAFYLRPSFDHYSLKEWISSFSTSFRF